MGRPPIAQKPSRPDSSNRTPQLSEIERKFYLVIKSKGDMGIWMSDLKREAGSNDNKAADKALKALLSKKLVKLVANANNKSRSVYMAVEFEPSKEISGGSWYSNGNLDMEFISILWRLCLNHVENLKVATVEMIWEAIRDSQVFNQECSRQQISEIINVMVLDKEAEECTSSGKGEFSNVPSGQVCYRSMKGRAGPKARLLSSIPCSVCPKISECAPDGIISPQNCVHYSRWLGMEF